MVLGAYLNGYSIVQELNRSGVEDIVVLQYGRDPAGFSAYVKNAVTIRKDAGSLKDALFKLNESYSYLVLFPTDDLQLELLKKNRERNSKILLPAIQPRKPRDVFR